MEQVAINIILSVVVFLTTINVAMLIMICQIKNKYVKEITVIREPYDIKRTIKKFEDNGYELVDVKDNRYDSIHLLAIDYKITFVKIK